MFSTLILSGFGAQPSSEKLYGAEIRAAVRAAILLIAVSSGQTVGMRLTGMQFAARGREHWKGLCVAALAIVVAGGDYWNEKRNQMEADSPAAPTPAFRNVEHAVGEAGTGADVESAAMDAEPGMVTLLDAVSSLSRPAIAVVSILTLLSFLSRWQQGRIAPHTAMTFLGLTMTAAVPRIRAGVAFPTRQHDGVENGQPIGWGTALGYAATAQSATAEPPVPPQAVDALVRAQFLGALHAVVTEAANCVDWSAVAALGRVLSRWLRRTSASAALALALQLAKASSALSPRWTGEVAAPDNSASAAAPVDARPFFGRSPPTGIRIVPLNLHDSDDRRGSSSSTRDEWPAPTVEGALEGVSGALRATAASLVHSGLVRPIDAAQVIAELEGGDIDCDREPRRSSGTGGGVGGGSSSSDSEADDPPSGTQPGVLATHSLAGRSLPLRHIVDVPRRSQAVASHRICLVPQARQDTMRGQVGSYPTQDALQAINTSSSVTTAPDVDSPAAASANITDEDATASAAASAAMSLAETPFPSVLTGMPPPRLSASRLQAALPEDVADRLGLRIGSPVSAFPVFRGSAGEHATLGSFPRSFHSSANSAGSSGSADDWAVGVDARLRVAPPSRSRREVARHARALSRLAMSSAGRASLAAMLCPNCGARVFAGVAYVADCGHCMCYVCAADAVISARGSGSVAGGAGSDNGAAAVLEHREGPSGGLGDTVMPVVVVSGTLTTKRTAAHRGQQLLVGERPICQECGHSISCVVRVN